MFLTGAYQDIMGDMHNLFGRVHEVHVFVATTTRGLLHRGSGSRATPWERRAGAGAYEPSDLAKRIKQALDGRVREGQVKPKEKRPDHDSRQAMRGYTYLGTE